MATKASMLQPSTEKEHSFSRITREGKKITYELNVLQQPHRARACGAGAKSSADRRPVDPPPVVQLRVFESDPNNEMSKTDITFAYNANFFLFATLEWARPMANGRVQGQPSSPVLTGVAVAGVAYLDRPSPAGHFIFPDLSVRHEGLYRLSFNLYEEIKLSKDEDKGKPLPPPDTGIPSSMMKPRAPEQYLHFRLEVKSQMFEVFSAKKFPGLDSSTAISQVVAEQGCRVRIRREVRLRRREKHTEKYGYGDRHMTPDTFPGTPVERPRSTSNVSMDNPYGYCPTPQHPSSVQDMGYPPHQPYHQPSLPPPPPPQPPPGPANASVRQSHHLEFGNGQPQYCAPQPPTQPPAPAPRASYPSPHPGYSPHTRQISAGSDYDAQSSKYPPYASPRPQSERSDQSRASLPPIATSLDTSYNSRPNDHRLPDAKTYQMPMPKTPVPASQEVGAVPQSIAADPNFAQPVSIHGPPRPRGPASYETAPPMSSKRAYGEVFSSNHHSQRLYDGQRPNDALEKDPSFRKILDDDPEDRPTMTYQRANGSLASKPDRTAVAK